MPRSPPWLNICTQHRDNIGIVQTGPGAQARILRQAVELGSPATVGAPAGDLLGLPKRAVRVFVGRDEQFPLTKYR